MKARLSAAASMAVVFLYVLIVANPQNASAGQAESGSQLQIIGKDGKVTGFVPLKHTSIKTEISGFVARIEVTQEFENVLPAAVEAVYVFPLPHESAVDGMTLTVGQREIHAVIKERDEARKIFEQARNTGHTAALLDQERPNIFTQSVTNIPPSGKVEIKLSVIELLKYEAGVMSLRSRWWLARAIFPATQLQQAITAPCPIPIRCLMPHGSARLWRE